MADENKWVIDRINIKSFLGVGSDGITVDLDRPITVLQGPNGSGKSTVISAIEWALFGRLTVNPSHNVRGVGNNAATYRSLIHDSDKDCEVTLEFHDGTRILNWTRTRTLRNPNPDRDDIECTIDGQTVEPDTWEIFKLDAGLYARAIAPKQTTLRNIVHNESADRNGTLDTLFGIEQLNGLSVGLSKGHMRIRSTASAFADRYQNISERLKIPVSDQFDRRSQARRVAIASGIGRSQLNRETAINNLVGLSNGLEVKFDPIPDSVSDLLKTAGSLQSHADQAWANPGPQQKLDRLRKVSGTAQGVWSTWQESIATAGKAGDDLNSLIAASGDEESVTRVVAESNAKLAEAQTALSDANSRAAVLERGKAWIEDHEHQSDVDCPLCQRKIETGELSAAIESSLELLRGADGEITRLEKDIQTAQDSLDAARRIERNLIAAVAKQSELEVTAKDNQSAAVKGISEHLSLWKDMPQMDTSETRIKEMVESVSELIEDSEDVSVKLDILIRDLITLGEQALNETLKDVEQAGHQVGQMRERIIATQRLLEFLEQDEKLSEQDAILSGLNLDAANSSVESVKSIEATVSALATAAGEISNAEATDIARALSEPLGKWFERLSRHQKLKGAVLTTEVNRTAGLVRNTYMIRATDTHGDNPVPAGPNLSGGYEMILAVAALCAMQEVSALDHKLGLFILEEPTDSLDGELEKAMGSSLGLHAPGPRTVITTNRPNFAEMIQGSAGDARSKVVNLEDWTVSGGTKISS